MANVVPVRKDQHIKLKVSQTRGLEHVASQHVAPITAREYAHATNSYPIVFVKDPDSPRYRSVVMMGLEMGENLYYTDGKMNATYLPQNISMVPFGLGLDPDKEKTLTTCVDLDSEYVGEDKEVALFDDEGKESEFYRGIQEALGRLYDNEIMTEKFIQELIENDLLQELELNINYSAGENKKLIGLFGIDEQKIQALSDEKILDFHKRGLFIPIHAMLSSLGQIHRLAQLRNLSDSDKKVSGIQFRAVQAEEKKDA